MYCLTLDGENLGDFADVQALYKTEQSSILKSTPLTSSSVYPSRLKFQDIQLVVKVFNEKVITALRLQKKHETANFMQQVLTWWNIVNVATKGEDQKFNDPDHAVQSKSSVRKIHLFPVTQRTSFRKSHRES